VSQTVVTATLWQVSIDSTYVINPKDELLHKTAFPYRTRSLNGSAIVAQL
jgi:hypothetical protein